MLLSSTNALRGRVWKNMAALSRPISKLRMSSYEHPSYDRLEDITISEYNLKGSIYKHKKSGAEIISLIAPDDNKVFGITFRTPPHDSTGVPHILEHSVLCGSKKFPVKEPFVELLKGSLQNFLNAFTYPDRTCYPIATTNTKDFYNLIHVYLDAVLNPRAVKDPLVLQQEGWHYELTNPSDPLTIKGVVYNEMKGVYSNPDSLMGEATQQALFPHNTYHVDSGGNPKDIPKLTFEQFQAFHREYYHPSNSKIFFYGDDDPKQRLILLDEYLQEFTSIPTSNSQIQYQKKLSLLPKVEVKFPISPESEPKRMISLNWLLNEQTMTEKENLALALLEYLLMGTSTSTLQKTLIESGLGEGVIGGLSDELLQATFAIGMKGIDETNVLKVQELITKSLMELSVIGFENDAIEAAVNTLEFKLREFNTGSYPKGLSIMLAMMKNWIYDRNPVESVTFEQPLKELKQELKDGKPIFQDLLKKYLVNNSHKVIVEMIPDKELEQQQIEEETNRLASIKANLTETEIDQIIKSTVALKEAQEREDTPEAKAMLPKLSLQDLEPNVRDYPLDITKDMTKGDRYTLLTHDLPTNGILYTDMVLDYSHVRLEDLELLPLFSRMLMEAGTKHYDATTLSRKIGANTGGIGISFYNDLKGKLGIISDPDDAFLYLMIRGKATVEKIPILFELIEEILLNANLHNQKRAIEMLKESKMRKESSILSSGHSYAMSRLGAKHSFLGYLNEVSGGLTSVRNAGFLLEKAETDWESIQERLENIRKAIIRTMKANSNNNNQQLVVNLTGEKTILSTAIPIVDQFISHLPEITEEQTPSVLETWKTNKKKLLFPSAHEGFTIPTQVNYVVKGGALYTPGEEVDGSTSVVINHLSNTYLWDTVRVQGGAYGGSARFSDASGRMAYISYRDPNLLQTLDAYDGAVDFLTEQELSSEELVQSIIGTIGEMDSPRSVDQKGYVSMIRFLSGITMEDRQAWRTRIINTSSEDFKIFAERMKKLRDDGIVVVFGSQQALEEANIKLSENKKLKIQPAVQSKKKEATKGPHLDW